MTAKSFAESAPRHASQTEARSAYALLKCGFSLSLMAASIAPCAFASAANNVPTVSERDTSIVAACCGGYAGTGGGFGFCCCWACAPFAFASLIGLPLCNWLQHKLFGFGLRIGARRYFPSGFEVCPDGGEHRLFCHSEKA